MAVTRSGEFVVDIARVVPGSDNGKEPQHDNQLRP